MNLAPPDITLRRFLVVCLVSSALAATATAQEGHPLVGSWHGDWTVGGATRQDLTVIFDYTPDGAGVTGLANPGYDHASLQQIQLTIPKPTEWQVSFEVELKDKAGQVTRYVAHGALDKIGSDRRTLTGTWSAGTAKGDFKLIRDRDYSR
jgi:hypothetical protein